MAQRPVVMEKNEEGRIKNRKKEKTKKKKRKNKGRKRNTYSKGYKARKDKEKEVLGSNNFVRVQRRTRGRLK